jgi:DNA-binding MarR family transcriptional regulator
MHADQPAESDGTAVTVALEVLPRIVRLLTLASANPGPGPEPLTLTQFRLLKHLGEGPLMTTVLAARLEVTPATVSAAIDGLVRRGMVERLPSTGDRRAVPLRCTPDGHAALEAARARQHAALSRLFSALSPQETRELADGLRAVRRVLAERHGH